LLKSVKRNVVSIIILLGFTTLSIAVCKEMTLPLSQRMTNGNPALLLWIPTAFSLALMLFRTMQLVRHVRQMVSTTAARWMAGIGIGIGGFSGLQQLQYAITYVRDAAAHDALDSASLNGLLFNEYVLLFTLGAGVAFGCRSARTTGQEISR
jgi:hypothetical protein